ncbi:hypothetical protein WA158_002290 [Blastocystis sp. Blastoise]
MNTPNTRVNVTPDVGFIPTIPSSIPQTVIHESEMTDRPDIQLPEAPQPSFVPELRNTDPLTPVAMPGAIPNSPKSIPNSPDPVQLPPPDVHFMLSPITMQSIYLPPEEAHEDDTMLFDPELPPIQSDESHRTDDSNKDVVPIVVPKEDKVHEERQSITGYNDMQSLLYMSGIIVRKETLSDSSIPVSDYPHQYSIYSLTSNGKINEYMCHIYRVCKTTTSLTRCFCSPVDNTFEVFGNGINSLLILKHLQIKDEEGREFTCSFTTMPENPIGLISHKSSLVEDSYTIYDRNELPSMTLHRDMKQGQRWSTSSKYTERFLIQNIKTKQNGKLNRNVNKTKTASIDDNNMIITFPPKSTLAERILLMSSLFYIFDLYIRFINIYYEFIHSNIFKYIPPICSSLHICICGIYQLIQIIFWRQSQADGVTPADKPTRPFHYIYGETIFAFCVIIRFILYICYFEGFIPAWFPPTSVFSIVVIIINDCLPTFLLLFIAHKFDITPFYTIGTQPQMTREASRELVKSFLDAHSLNVCPDDMDGYDYDINSDSVFGDSTKYIENFNPLCNEEDQGIGIPSVKSSTPTSVVKV